MKKWFDKLEKLEKREQVILLVGFIVVVSYVMFGVLYKGLVNTHQTYKNKVMVNQETLEWMQPTVQKIVMLKGSSGTSATSGESLAQLSENAAKQSGIRIGRFQPKGENEAQVWLEKVEFSNALTFLGHLEIDNGLNIDDLAISSANSPGMVNLRLKFSK